MIPVSTEWHDAITKQFRYQGYLSVAMEVAPVGMNASAIVDAPATESVSTTLPLTDIGRKNPKAYASIEPNRWKLNGKYRLLKPTEKTDDWWSTPIDPSAPAVITFTFDKEYTIPGLYFEWDLINHTYPRSLTVAGYNSTDALVNEYVVNTITSDRGFIEVPLKDIQKIVIIITQWSKDNWRGRINNIVFGFYELWESTDRIMSAESIDSSNPIGSELPVHSFSITLRNADRAFDPTLQNGLSRYLTRRQRITCQWGFQTDVDNIEWTSGMPYYLQEFSIPADSKEVQLKATSLLEFLTDPYKRDTLAIGTQESGFRLEPRNLYDIATSIFTSLDIPAIFLDHPFWEIPESFKNFETRAPMPKIGANALLQLIAGLTNHWLLIDPMTSKITFQDAGVAKASELPTSITENQQIGDPRITAKEQLKSVTIGVYSYNGNFKDTNESDLPELAKGEYTVTGIQTYTIEYSEQWAMKVECEVTGATRKSFKAYSSYAEVTVEAPEPNSKVTITLRGIEIVQSVSYIETYNNTEIQNGVRITLDNPLVTNDLYVDSLTKWLVAWYSKRQQLELEYLGYPETTAGDTITIDNYYTKGLEAKVLSNKIVFNGGFTGTMTAQ